MTKEELEKLKQRSNILTCEGKPISVRNHVLVELQAETENMTVKMIGGFKQWLKTNRVVKKGEKAKLSILIPCGMTKSEEGDTDPRFFKWVPMFDISQTEEIH